MVKELIQEKKPVQSTTLFDFVPRESNSEESKVNESEHDININNNTTSSSNDRSSKILDLAAIELKQLKMILYTN